MTELESMIFKEVFAQSLLKLYMRYVDFTTMLLVKEKDSDLVEKHLNSIKALNSLLIFLKMEKYISLILILLKTKTCFIINQQILVSK